MTYSFGAPAATVTDVCTVKVLDVYLIHHFGVLLLDLQVDQAVSLLLLLRQEWANGQVAQQSEDTQEGQQPEPLRHCGQITSILHTHTHTHTHKCTITTGKTVLKHKLISSYFECCSIV